MIKVTCRSFVFDFAQCKSFCVALLVLLSIFNTLSRSYAQNPPPGNGEWQVELGFYEGGYAGTLENNADNYIWTSDGLYINPVLGSDFFPNILAQSSDGALNFTLKLGADATAMIDPTVISWWSHSKATVTVAGKFVIRFRWRPKSGDMQKDPPPTKILVRNFYYWRLNPRINPYQGMGPASSFPPGYWPIGYSEGKNKIKVGDEIAEFRKIAVFGGGDTDYPTGTTNKTSPLSGIETVDIHPVWGTGSILIPFEFNSTAEAEIALAPLTGQSAQSGLSSLVNIDEFIDYPKKLEVCLANIPAWMAFIGTETNPEFHLSYRIEGMDFSKGVADHRGEASDPSYTRWVPLAFSPKITSQPIRQVVGPLPAPWGNIDCLYSIKKRTEVDEDNPVIALTYYHPNDGRMVTRLGNNLVIYDANGDRLIWRGGVTPAPDVHSQLLGDTLINAGPPGAMRQKGTYTYKFDSQGRLWWFEDELGNRQTLLWQGNGSLNVSDSSSGRSLLFTPGAGGYFTSVTAPGPIPTLTLMNWDTGGHVTNLQVMRANGTVDHTDQWFYGGPNGDSIIEERVGGVTTTYGWGSSPYKDRLELFVPRLNSVTAGLLSDTSSSDNGDSVQGTYQIFQGTSALGYGHFGVDARTNAVTDPRGAVWKQILGYNLDWLDNTYTDPVVKSVRYIGPDYTGTAADSNHSTVKFEPSALAPTKITATNALGYNWVVDLDTLGNLTKLTNPLGAPTLFGYSLDGTKLTSIKDATNITTNFYYGENNNPASRLTRVRDQAGFDQLLLGYNSFGQLTQLMTPAATAASGQTESLVADYYTSTGDLLSVTDPLGGRVSYLGYTSLGDISSMALFPVTGNPALEPFPLLTSFQYNAAQDVTQVTFPNGLELHHNINDQGQRLDSKLKTSSGTVLGQLNFEYDSRGRLHHAFDSFGDLINIKFDKTGNVTKSYDGNGHVTTLNYGLAGDLSSVLTAAGRQASFAYQADGSLRALTDARGITTNFGYDFAGRPSVTWITGQPDEMTVTQYDAAGRPIQVSTPTGKTVAFAYNHLNKWLTSVTTTMPLSGGTSRTHVVSYTYYPDGSRQSMTTQATGTLAQTTNYTYDVKGRLKTLTSPSGAVTTWVYDFIDRPLSQTTVYATGGSVGTTWEYGPSGQVGDPSNAPIYLRALKHYVNGSLARQYSIAYTNVGEVVSIGETGGGDSATHGFVYDGRGRLTNESETRSGTVNYTASRTYTFDANNNLNAGGNGWQYDADNLLISAPAVGGMPGISPIVHDAPSGKVMQAGDKVFTYDAWGRVKTIASNSSAFPTLTYEYDALGRKFSATNANDVRYFDYDGDLLIGEQSNIYTAEHLDDILVACLDGHAGIEEALELSSLQNGWSYRQYEYGAGGLMGHTAYDGNNTYVYDPQGNLVGVYHGDPLSATAVERFFARNGMDVHGNPIATGGAPNAPPYGTSPFSGNGSYRDPYTGLQSSASSGMAGAYNPAVSADDEDDLDGFSPYRGMMSKVNQLAGYGKAGAEFLASFHPAVNAQSAILGRDAASGCKLNPLQRLGAGLAAVPAVAVEATAVKGAEALAEGAHALTLAGKAPRYSKYINNLKPGELPNANKLARNLLDSNEARFNTLATVVRDNNGVIEVGVTYNTKNIPEYTLKRLDNLAQQHGWVTFTASGGVKGVHAESHIPSIMKNGNVGATTRICPDCAQYLQEMGNYIFHTKLGNTKYPTWRRP